MTESRIIKNIVAITIFFIEEKGLNIVFDANTEEKIIACDPDKIERINVEFSDIYLIS